jgi:hypothetical protein
MPFAHSLIESAPMLAFRAGTFVVLGLILGGVLVIYAIYWMIFKMGKD